MAADSQLMPFEKLRSNSECLYCTGQALDRLLDDPDFMKDFENNKGDYEDDEEDEEEKEDDFFGNENQLDMKSNYYSHINYDQYEYQQPILDDLEFSAYNVPQNCDKFESLDEWQRDYSLMLEIIISNDKLKESPSPSSNTSPTNNSNVASCTGNGNLAQNG